MHHQLARIGFILLALCFLSTTPRPAAADTALGTSTWSLELASDLGTGNEDFSFAVRRHSGASSAFRFGIQVDANKEDGDGTVTDTGNPDTDAEVSSASGNFAFSVQWMRFAGIRDNVTATFALGPVLQTQRAYFRQAFDEGLPSFNEVEIVQKRTTYGVELGLGVEWFLNRRISLGGQTGIRATTGTGAIVQVGRSGTGATASKTEINVENDVTEVTTSTARFQLTAYF